MARSLALSALLLLAAACARSDQVPDQIGHFGCGIAMMPEQVGSAVTRGAVQQVIYQDDRDDVAGELATVEVLTESGSTRSLRFWAGGRLPFAAGDRLEATARCRPHGSPLLRCDGTFRVDGQLVLVIASSTDVRLPDGWSVKIGRPDGGYRQVDETITAAHVLLVAHGGSAVEVGMKHGCRRVRLAGASWLASGSAVVTRSTNGTGTPVQVDRFVLSLARSQ